MAQQDEMAVVLYVGRHRLEARILTAGYRLLDILNDRLNEFLELYDVQVTADGAEIGNALPHAVVAKARITLAAILEDSHEAEERRRFSTVEKDQHPARAIVSDFEIEGNMHLEGSPDPALALSGELDTFFAITQASLFHPPSGLREDAQVVMPNKSELAFLHIAQPERGRRRSAA
jgi:hypothetical protein